jgi:hypothetical protein
MGFFAVATGAATAVLGWTVVLVDFVDVAAGLVVVEVTVVGFVVVVLRVVVVPMFLVVVVSTVVQDVEVVEV